MAASDERATDRPGRRRGGARAAGRGAPSWPTPRARPTPASTPTDRWRTSTSRERATRAPGPRRVNAQLPRDVRLLEVADGRPRVSTRAGTRSGRSTSTAGAAPASFRRGTLPSSRRSRRARTSRRMRPRPRAARGAAGLRRLRRAPAARRILGSLPPTSCESRRRGTRSARSFAATRFCAAWCGRSAGLLADVARGKVPAGAGAELLETERPAPALARRLRAAA